MKELKRKLKVLDMMVSMHSVLRDRYKIYSNTTSILLIIFSAMLCFLSFADEIFLQRILFTKPENIKYILGLFSFFIFLISLVISFVNWKEKSGLHKQAFDQLCRLLNEGRILYNQPEADVINQLPSFFQRNIEINELIDSIPDSKFNSLKSKHYKKIELSKMIDSYPSAPIIILRIKLLIHSLRKKEEINSNDR